VSDVARRYGMSPQHLFIWRWQAKQEAGDQPLALTPIAVTSDASRSILTACCEAVIEIVVEGAIVRVPHAVDGTTLITVLQALKRLR
jgi:transposase